MITKYVKLTLITEALGLSPSDPEIYKTFIGRKLEEANKKTLEKEKKSRKKSSKDDTAKTEAEDIEKEELMKELSDSKIQKEIEALMIGDETSEDGKKTVFPRDSKGRPMAWSYQWKGFFKDACAGLKRMKDEDIAKESIKLKNYKAIIDSSIFVYPDKITIKTLGDIGVCERPLRADTMQGPRVALASSETVPAGSYMEFYVVCPDVYGKVIDEWFHYGFFRGFSQWRNSGKGRFVVEITDSKGFPDKRIMDPKYEQA